MQLTGTPLPLGADLNRAIADWLDHLSQDRDYTEKTCEAYGRDLAQFNPETTYFNLAIETPNEIELPVITPAAQIARSVKLLVGITECMRVQYE